MFYGIRKFWRKNIGQDLAEYCLLTALLALVALGLIVHASGGLQNLWTTANSTLASNGNGGNSGATGTGATGTTGAASGSGAAVRPSGH